ncbi:MAG: DNA-formamidopyrimidine glycosylase [Phycisphaerae bacterium]
MPELPEVETIVRMYGPRLAGRTVREFIAHVPAQVLPDVATVRARLSGRRIERVSRRGKFIVFQLAPAGVLLVHLRMSGRFEWVAPGAAAQHRHIRAEWQLDDGARLLFDDARKFGRIRFCDDSAAFGDRIGVEPLDHAFTVDVLARLLRARRRQLKPLLLDQSVVAGLGNIYTDEALWRAQLHPLANSARLSREQIVELHAAIRRVLREGIRRNGTSIDWVYPEGRMQNYLKVYGRTGAACTRCRATIVALRVGQRGTHICPNCQRRSVPGRGRRIAPNRTRSGR